MNIILGQERYNEIERRYFINRLIGFLEFVEDIRHLREILSKRMKENSQYQDLNKIYLKFIKTEEEFIREINKNEHVSKMLKIATELRDSKLKDSIKLRNSISIEELKSFFNKIKYFNVTYEEVLSSIGDVIND
ncbi:MAG TPA: hypothetical protein VFM31_05500 [Nitrososphaeraceae archaeon]|nr:hypothetical protein [Nitrososphaeraceae archaeon]